MGTLRRRNARTQTSPSPLFLRLLPVNANRRRASYANGSCIELRAGITCIWDELAQDWERTWLIIPSENTSDSRKTPPLPTPRPLRASQLDAYEDSLLERWSQGERNAAQLYREISARGYRGAAPMVRAYVGHLRTTTANGSP